MQVAYEFHMIGQQRHQTFLHMQLSRATHQAASHVRRLVQLVEAVPAWRVADLIAAALATGPQVRLQASGHSPGWIR
jgi:hypothetical protein